MGLVSKLVNFVRSKCNSDKRAHYIFYKIVDSLRNDNGFILQCIKTSATFNAKITDIVFDLDILHGLHPIQACYIGIEYATYLKNESFIAPKLSARRNVNHTDYSVFRYGIYQISYQDRKGNVCFVNQITGETFLMDPRDIALSEKLIQEFDAAQAFQIGVFSGLKLNNPMSKQRQTPKTNKPYIRLVK